MWPLRTIAYFSLFWVGCLAALFNPIWGVVNYMAAYQSNPPVTWWGKPLSQLGMRFSMLAAGFTLIGLLTGRRKVPLVRPALSFWEMCAISLVLVAILNTMLGTGFGPSARGAFDKFWKLQIFVLILARLATTRVNLNLVLWTLVLGSLQMGYDAYTAPVSAFWKGRLTSFGGSDINTSSTAAAHLTAMLPIIGVVYMCTRSWLWKIAALASGAFTVNAIVLCRTRSAFVGIVCGALVAIIMAPRARRFRIHAMLIIGGLLALTLTDSHYWERINTLTQQQTFEEDYAAVSRFDIWLASVDILSDYPLGVGLGNFTHVIGQYDPRYANRSPHNTMILCFVELGIVGGIIFLILIAESFRLILRCYRMASQIEEDIKTKLLIYGMLVSLVSYFIAGLGTERFSCESFWWILVLPLCMHRTIMREVTAEAEMPALALQQADPWEPAYPPAWQHGY